MNTTKIITVANRKGGAGKSTCAAHFALEATKRGLKVILIDLDPQKTLEQWWEKREDDNPFLADTNASALIDKITMIKNKDFDLCIIDTPGDLSINATIGIQAADLIIIPSKPTSPDLRSIGRTIGLVKENRKDFIFVITQAISRSNIALEAASVLSEFGPLAPSTIANRVAYANAMSDGSSASQVDKNAAEEIEAIWTFIEAKLWKKTNNTAYDKKEKI
jgi:chromosome partitioning protein